MINKDSLEDARVDYIRIANYYYFGGLTQAEIAKCMGMSRQRVNRILSKCVELGIVQIHIEGADNTHFALEMELEKKFGLKAVRIAEKVLAENDYLEIGKLAAKYLAGIINGGDTLGFSRGRTISALVDQMPVLKSNNVTVTQLMGSWNEQQAKVNVDDIVNRFCNKANATPNILYAPIVVKNPTFREAIMNEPFFHETYDVIKSCSVAVVGIGDTNHEHILPFLGDEDHQFLRDNNVAGEICTHFFNADGMKVKTPFDNRIIAVELDDYLTIPTRIGVAGGQYKVPAILGALRGGYINALVTDIDTAQLLSEI